MWNMIYFMMFYDRCVMEEKSGSYFSDMLDAVVAKPNKRAQMFSVTFNLAAFRWLLLCYVVDEERQWIRTHLN